MKRTRSASESSSRRSVVAKPKLVIAQVEDVAFVDLLRFDAVAAVFDAVGRAQIFDVVVPVMEDHGAVFARDVTIADREVGLLAATTDDELVFIDRIAVVVKDQRERRATTRGKPLPATEATLRLLWLLWGSLLPSARVRARRGRGRTTRETSGRGRRRWRVAKATATATTAGGRRCRAPLLPDRRHALEGAVVHVTALETDVEAIDGLATATGGAAAAARRAAGAAGRRAAVTDPRIHVRRQISGSDLVLVSPKAWVPRISASDLVLVSPGRPPAGPPARIHIFCLFSLCC